MTDYQQLQKELAALIEGVPYPIANLANASALIFQMMEDLNWAGFYLSEGETLILGPFQGKPACIRLSFGKGVCGTAAKEDRTVLVEDVHAFPGHIACDGASNSEIVVPIHQNGTVYGVLDLDSPVFSRFTPEDAAGLEGAVRILEKALNS